MMEEKSPDLPKGWVWAKLDQVSDIVLGQSPPSATYNDEKIGLPFFQGKKEFGDIYPLVSRWCSEPKKIAEKEDILISVRAPVGPTNICAQRSCIGRGLAAIRSAQYLNHLLLLYYLRMSESKIAKKGTGSTFSAISGRQLRGMNIPLPPLPEQYRIVAKIEELFTNLDAGIESLKKVQVQIKRYRQAVLKQAFEGKLTAGWREANKDQLEPVSGRIDETNREGNSGPLPGTTKLPKLPPSWQWVKVRDIGKTITGNTPSKKIEKYYSNKKYPFFKPTDLNNGYYVTDSADGLSVEGILEARPLPKKSILVTCIGATIGKTGFIRLEGAPNQQINAIVTYNNIIPEYIYFACTSTMFQKSIHDNASSTTLPILNKTKFENLIFPMCSYLEQQKIVEEIEHRFSIADRVEEMVEQNLRRAEHLRQSILKKAFAGKLVTQDPTDEPASVLLERIRVEKEKSASKEKQRKRSKQ